MAECVNKNSVLPKQDCTSPSPTETVSLDSSSSENNPGEYNINTFCYIIKDTL